MMQIDRLDKHAYLVAILMIVWWIGFNLFAIYVIDDKDLSLLGFNSAMVAVFSAQGVIAYKSYRKLFKLLKTKWS